MSQYGEQKSILVAVQETPSTAAIIAVLSCIWFYLWNYRIEYTTIGFNYKKVKNEKQYWRAITSSLAHIHFLHIIMNVFSLWTIAEIETKYGSVEYLEISLLIILLSTATIQLITWVLVTRFNREREASVFSLGYSGVVFGWMTLYVMKADGQLTLFGMQLPPLAILFGTLFITQVIVPNASFVGHSAGIVVGFMVYFGLFSWLNHYMYIVMAIVAVLGFIHSVRTTTDFTLHYFVDQHCAEGVCVCCTSILSSCCCCFSSRCCRADQGTNDDIALNQTHIRQGRVVNGVMTYQPVVDDDQDQGDLPI